jgi:hypothetical protein
VEHISGYPEFSFARHARPCAGHPRLFAYQTKDVDGRNKSAHDAVNDLASQFSYERFVKIVPLWIRTVDEPNLPCAGPVFDSLLALNCVPDVIIELGVNQLFQAVAFCESNNQSLPVLKGSSRQIARDADIQNAVTPIGHEIDPATCHSEI